MQQNRAGNTSGYNNEVLDAARCLVQVYSGVALEQRSTYHKRMENMMLYRDGNK